MVLVRGTVFSKYLAFFICISLLTACSKSRAVLWHGIHATPSMIAVQREVEKTNSSKSYYSGICCNKSYDAKELFPTLWCRAIK